MTQLFYIKWNMELNPRIVEYHDNDQDIVDMSDAQQVLKQFQLDK